MPSSGVQTCALDRKSTRLNSSHTIISYAVFCLKKNTFDKIKIDQRFTATLGQSFEATDNIKSHHSVTTNTCNSFEATAIIEAILVFFLMIGRPPISTLFPTPPLFR